MTQRKYDSFTILYFSRAFEVKNSFFSKVLYLDIQPLCSIQSTLSTKAEPEVSFGLNRRASLSQKLYTGIMRSSIFALLLFVSHFINLCIPDTQYLPAI